MRKKGISQELITTQEAAENLGYTIQHTRLLIRRGQIDATKFGRDWLVVRESVVEYKTSGVKRSSDNSDE
jgi:excisionase family DNA binding protein